MLEYPTWDEFENRLKKGDIDVLGISFYMKDGGTVLKMIETARKYGVKEIWGGNYGVLCDEIAERFDRVFLGYAENDVREALDMVPLDEIKHPAITTTFGIHGTPFRIKQGLMFTTRGCTARCDFCQTNAFVPKISKIPIDSIEEVLLKYKKMGLFMVYILDETFMSQRSHCEEVVDLLHKHGFTWGIQTRADMINGRVAELKEKGMLIVEMGVESFNPDNLASIQKRTAADIITDTLDELSRNKIYLHAYFMLGYENDTEEDVLADITLLAKTDIQSSQITIMTPLPHTPLWDRLERKYGIFEKDYSKFDAYHLTWNHPNISKARLEELRDYAWKKNFNARRMYSGFDRACRAGLVRKAFFGRK